MQIAIRRMGLWGGAILGLAACASPTPQPDPKDMTFFVSSVSPGKGGDLGGLAGADRHCSGNSFQCQFFRFFDGASAHRLHF